MRAVEELAHGDGRGAVLADLAEVGEVFGRERVFQEEQPELLGLLAELHGLVGRDALMHVVQQLDLVAQFVAADFEQLQRAAHVGAGSKSGLSCSAFDRRRAAAPAP